MEMVDENRKAKLGYAWLTVSTCGSGMVFISFQDSDAKVCVLIIVDLRTPAMPVGVGGGKERG